MNTHKKLIVYTVGVLVTAMLLSALFLLIMAWLYSPVLGGIVTFLGCGLVLGIIADNV